MPPERCSCLPVSCFQKYLFIWLPQVLAATRGSEPLVATGELLVVACGGRSLTRDQNPGPLHWECGDLATGPLGKSLVSHLYLK